MLEFAKRANSKLEIIEQAKFVATEQAKLKLETTELATFMLEIAKPL